MFEISFSPEKPREKAEELSTSFSRTSPRIRGHGHIDLFDRLGRGHAEEMAFDIGGHRPGPVPIVVCGDRACSAGGGALRVLPRLGGFLTQMFRVLLVVDANYKDNCLEVFCFHPHVA